MGVTPEERRERRKKHDENYRNRHRTTRRERDADYQWRKRHGLDIDEGSAA